jgi:hypothetical protein
VQIGGGNLCARFREWPNYEARAPEVGTLFFNEWKNHFSGGLAYAIFSFLSSDKAASNASSKMPSH